MSRVVDLSEPLSRVRALASALIQIWPTPVGHGDSIVEV
jgi:hypothetical protein